VVVHQAYAIWSSPTLPSRDLIAGSFSVLLQLPVAALCRHAIIARAIKSVGALLRTGRW